MALALKLYQRRALESLERFLDAARLGNPDEAFAKTVDKGLFDQYKPMPGLPHVPYACLRIPTGGGKTVMGAHIIQAAGRTLLDREFPLVMWMVPTTQIKTQTLEAFRDPRHPYRQELDDAFNGQVAVFDVADFAQIRPADLGTKVCIVISTVAALRVENQEGRKVYEHHEDMEPHFAGSTKELDYLEKGADGKALASFANLLKLHGPLVIMDEAHNATTPLSYTVYERLGPRAVVELTATPDTTSSNVLVSVSAFELKAENMIKFPVVLKEHNGEWQAAVSSAVARRKSLAQTALGEPEYIRPILLVQAENARGVATVEEVKRHLIDVDGIDPKAIAIATGDAREIDGIDLFAKDCPIEAIITKQALKEGWDCSFAYVFCSVAQVHSDKDIQQLLGRVLRMPYASPRRQGAMNKAYAHVVTDSFGRAAGELTQSLVNIGFNPMEAANAIRRENAETEPLPLQGGGIVAPELPKTRIEVRKAPDFTDAPERDKERVAFIPDPEGGPGGTVEISDEIDVATVEAIVLTAPPSKRDEIAGQVERHQLAVVAAKAPSERGVAFRVPRLCLMEQGELELIDRGMVSADFKWDLLASPPDLSSFRASDDSMTFEVYLEDHTVQYHHVKDDVATYLPGFAQDRTVTDLIGWLDHEIRDPSVKQPVLREWVRRAVDSLLNDRGFSLAQLLRGQFVLRRKLEEQLLLAKDNAYRGGFEQLLFGQGNDIVASDAPDHTFTYPADMSRYPAHWYYRGAYRFRKHYYPVPGDLSWKTPGGAVTEEFECAQAIDTLDEVEFWVRNLVHPTQFWMPTSSQRTYPDFVAKLKDGRLLVVEYKGGDRFTADQEKEKRMVGELWAKRSGGKGLYLMARKIDDSGHNVREQLSAVLS
ncbi:DEAD/DEAH box helicase family protein [Pseudoxanthomonas sangjuensis]|uniref:DEAD/DEAH box helicase n=1 Tax=Pseudoxanthomonas sangjuensis TaxID=1503750 RepID=UPI0013916132|nr:DEAD/DEAH box helicase family protein [Pseudoxanthomonas sangjuensis]KAF1713187.1 type III restriction endonuclease subunit R [Pseudoxanthomonas sangjuensis]